MPYGGFVNAAPAMCFKYDHEFDKDIEITDDTVDVLFFFIYLFTTGHAKRI